jgi:8-oxo-dGTP diphosphatase
MVRYVEEEYPEKATLCYVFDDSEVLMIEKKRGHGEGKIVGPGGVVEGHDSTVRHAATRETVEETAVVPYSLEKVGELGLIFEGDLFQHVDVFTAEGYLGEPQETLEGEPDWYDMENLPYQRMWDTDDEWMPLMLQGQNFRGEFFFDQNSDLESFDIESADF